MAIQDLPHLPMSAAPAHAPSRARVARTCGRRGKERAIVRRRADSPLQVDVSRVRLTRVDCSEPEINTPLDVLRRTPISTTCRMADVSSDPVSSIANFIPRRRFKLCTAMPTSNALPSNTLRYSLLVRQYANTRTVQYSAPHS